MSRKLKIAALQKRIGSHLSLGTFERMHESGVDLVCLPEYFFIGDAVRDQTETAGRRQALLGQLEAYSRSLAGIVVGGSLIEKAGDEHYNTCHIFDSGRHVGYYRKRHLTEREKAAGLSPGERPAVFEVRGFRLGILICADVLVRDYFRELGELKAEVVAVPTVSPFIENDTVADKYSRDREYFVRGAQMAGAYVIKACGVGTLMGGRLQGRSLICSPQKVITRIVPSRESLEATLIEEVDLDSLRLPLAPAKNKKHHLFVLPPGLDGI